jgi:hypothetical protein
LRVGLPTVSESGFPNDHLIRDTGHGCLVEPGRIDLIVDALQRMTGGGPNREGAIEHILRHHTWTRRAETYDRILRAEFGSVAGTGVGRAPSSQPRA